MKITKQQILKMIQEEISEELSENFLSRLFGFGKDKEDEKPKAEPEPEEPEEDLGCQDSQAEDVSEDAALQRAVGYSSYDMERDMKSYQFRGTHPARIVLLLGKLIEKEGVEVLKDKSKMREFGKRFEYEGDKYDYWKYAHRVNDISMYGTYYFEKELDKRTPCIKGDVLQNAVPNFHGHQ